jgi:hypothetical protein
VEAALFWLGVIFKRTPGFVKKYPAISVFLSVLVPCFFIFDIKRLSLNLEQFNAVLCVIVLLIFVNSFKFYDIMPVFIRYANTGLTAKSILSRHMLKRAICNAWPYFLFCGFIITRLIVLDFNYAYSFFIKMMFALFLFSLFCLYLLFLHSRIFAVAGGMLISASIIASIGSNYAIDIVNVVLAIINMAFMAFGIPSAKIHGRHTVKLPINPVVKSSIYDFFGSFFLHDTLLIISLFFVLLLRTTMENQIDDNIMLMALLLSVGFVSFIDAPSGINWRFYAIVKLDFYYQIKRAILFLLCIYGVLLVVFLLKYAEIQPGCFFLPFFGFVCMMFLSVGLAFMGGNIIARGLFGLFVAYLMIMHGNFNWHMLFLILPVIAVIGKARNNFIKWEWA